jgi:Cu/Ag efflux pump CusA
MTSLAFMLGVLPLLIANGAGAGSERALGTAVFGGMASATVLAIFFVPLFFVVVMRLFRVGTATMTPAQSPAAGTGSQTTELIVT